MLACALSLLVLLSPDLTLAPLSAVEPTRVASHPVDLPLTPARLPQRLDQPDTTAVVVVAPEPEPAPAPVVANPDAPLFVAALEAARATGGAYGITFAAVRDGQVLWTGAAGRARDGVTELRADDSLVIGSVTKTYVSATILQLVEEGRLRLDDRVADLLPPQPTVAPEITVRQLLDHTSGLADVFNDTTKLGIEQHPEHAWSQAELFRTLHAAWYGPGNGYAYANTNYYLLGRIVERLTGSALADELDRRFFTPLGLTTARLLTGDPAIDGTVPLEPAWTSIFWASGSMASSAGDLARWGDALYGDGVLSEASRTEMLKLHLENYGLGVQRIDVPGASGQGHTGMLKTFTSLLLYLPTEDVTLALLVNRTHVDLGGMLAARPLNGPSLLELVGVTLPPPAPVAPVAPVAPTAPVAPAPAASAP